MSPWQEALVWTVIAVAAGVATRYTAASLGSLVLASVSYIATVAAIAALIFPTSNT